MENLKNPLPERLLTFAANVVKLTDKLVSTPSSKHIANQLMRCATSAGANYEEACNAESRSDFMHKIQVSLKESQETLYWLKLLQKADMIPDKGQDLDKLLGGAQEINRILANPLSRPRVLNNSSFFNLHSPFCI